MLGTLLQIMVYGAGAGLVIYLVYSLFFANGGIPVAPQSPTVRRRLERRQPEMGPRRRLPHVARAAHLERRSGPRRASDVKQPWRQPAPSRDTDPRSTEDRRPLESAYQRIREALSR